MELLIHLSMILAIITVSLAGMDRSPSFFLRSPGPAPPDFNEGGSSVGFPWNPRSNLNSPQQSPIDICRCKCQPKKYPPLRIHYAKASQRDGIVVEISNSGHGVNLKVPRDEAKPFLAGGMLPNTYKMENIHLHWGKDDNLGSEHLIDAEAFPMECHLVTFNTKYKNLNEALENKNDGVVVFTFFFKSMLSDRMSVPDDGHPVRKHALPKIIPEDNRQLQNFLQYIPDVRKNGSKKLIADQEALLWFLQPVLNNEEYLAYPGSLTTPPFVEAVTFIICPTPVGVSSQQIAVLRTMMDDHKPSKPVLSNRREIQSLNQRPVVCVKGRIKTVPKEIAPESSNDV